MNVIGGILLYVAGVVTGAGGLALHQWDVKRTVSLVRQQKNAEIARLRNEQERMREEAGMMQQASDCADAFRRGRTQGRLQPMSGAERFARTFEDKRAQFVDTSKQG